MYILKLISGQKEHYVGMFNSLESGREFLNKVPGYYVEEYDGFVYESLDISKLGNIEMIDHNGYFIPLSNFSFEEDAIIVWIELDNIDKKGNKIVSKGATQVDAYLINNDEVKEYVEKREQKYTKCVQKLNKLGYETSRAGFMSEDGEYLLIRKDGQDWHFLMHLDPFFVDEMDVDKDLEDILKESGCN